MSTARDGVQRVHVRQRLASYAIDMAERLKEKT
jgi:hypothetical protein